MFDFAVSWAKLNGKEIKLDNSSDRPYKIKRGNTHFLDMRLRGIGLEDATFKWLGKVLPDDADGTALFSKTSGVSGGITVSTAVGSFLDVQAVLMPVDTEGIDASTLQGNLIHSGFQIIIPASTGDTLTGEEPHPLVAREWKLILELDMDLVFANS